MLFPEQPGCILKQFSCFIILALIKILNGFCVGLVCFDGIRADMSFDKTLGLKMAEELLISLKVSKLRDLIQ
jgi:hypothetical protein